MQNVSNINKFLLIVIVALFGSIIILMFPQYYIYYLPIIIILFTTGFFFEKLREKSFLIIWTILFLSIFLGGSRTSESILQQTVDPIRISRIIIMTCLAFFTILRLLLTEFKDLNGAFKGPLGLFLLYSIISMISALYSNQPLVSLWKGFEVFVCITVSIYVFQQLKSYEDINRFWTLNIVLLILLILSAYISAIVSPSEAFRELRDINFKQLVGVYPSINANSLTQMAAILTVVSFVRYLNSSKHKICFFLLLILALPALILSAGRTSIIGLLISLIIFLILNKNYDYLLLLGTGLVLFFWLEGYSYIKLFFERGGSLYTMSGRLNTWPVAWVLFKSSPIYGYGFYVASRIIFAQKVKIEQFSTTDNTYLDVLLSVGILGFLPFVLMLYSFSKKMVRGLKTSHNKDIRRFRLEILCVAIIIFFRSLTGPSIQILHWNLTLFLALIICTLSLENYESSLNPQLP